MWEHEDVVIRRGTRSGMAIMVAVHSRALGPAAGGCRLLKYPDWRDGLADALRLSEAMTYKCAVSGLPFGGGKSVIALPGGTDVTPQLRRAALADLGELIASFDGSYLAGPDVGTGPDDMVVLRESTPHVCCLPESRGGIGSSGGPTAVGVLAALRAGARRVFRTESMAGRVVVVVGLGAVGAQLAERLVRAGARVTVSDVDDRKRDLAERHGLEWVDPEKAMRVPADVVIPAAVGGVLNPGSVAELSASLVVGPANNQLTDDRVADLLARRGVVWVPDFVASAGGAIYTLAREMLGADHAAALTRVEAIGDTVERLLGSAERNATTPLHEAMALARHRIAATRVRDSRSV